MRMLKFLMVVPVLLLAGCFEYTGVHNLNYHGRPDGGGYRFAMDVSTYLLAAAAARDRGEADPIATLRQRFATYSSPRSRTDDGKIIVEDVSGTARMERAYDSARCADVGGARSECRFRLESRGLDIIGWKLVWLVVLRPEMTVVSSNHHTTRIRDGRRELIWTFDGNRTSTVDIDFTVRTPRA